jgi:hypothetical protein
MRVSIAIRLQEPVQMLKQCPKMAINYWLTIQNTAGLCTQKNVWGNGTPKCQWPKSWERQTSFSNSAGRTWSFVKSNGLLWHKNQQYNTKINTALTPTWNYIMIPQSTTSWNPPIWEYETPAQFASNLICFIQDSGLSLHWLLTGVSSGMWQHVIWQKKVFWLPKHWNDSWHIAWYC